jgi:6-phosphogluconolactonase
VARVTIVDAAALADTAAERVTALIGAAVAARGTAALSLAGGTTPKSLYEALADPSKAWRGAIDWSRVHLFWGDERHVPPDHPDSNYGMASRALIEHVAVPPAQVHRIHAERPDAVEAAAEYARELPDRFDVMLLGLGEDCHIASIFPGSELLGSTGTDRVRAVFAAHLNAWRITVTPAVILDSRAIVMLVSGAKKASAMAAAIDAAPDVVHYPGQLLRDANDRIEWLVDTAAASLLGDGDSK